MKPFPCAVPPRQQQGATLIALMIGLVISMLILIGTLLMFRNVSATSAGVKEDASAENKSISSALSGSLLMQEAGFGVTNPQLGTHLLVLSNATLSSSNDLTGTQVSTGTSRTGNAVIWETQPGTQRQCAGLYAPASGGLFSLPALDCSGASQYTTLDWVPVTIVPSPVSGNNGERQDGAVPVKFTFVATSQDCKPYGLTQSTGKVVMTLSADASNGQREALKLDQCLYNFHTP